MGTRGLTAVVVDGKYKIAQYGQWDHYPSGQGVTALDFCREYLTTEKGRAAFREALARVRFVAPDEHRQMWRSVGVKGAWPSTEQGRAFDMKWPFFSRDHGAKILELVLGAKGEVLLSNHIAFAADSLFCEWAYVIDLDERTFEVYQGFNQKPLRNGERFKFLRVSKRAEKREDRYYPVRLAHKFDLDNLPTKAVFLETLREAEDV